MTMKFTWLEIQGVVSSELLPWRFPLGRRRGRPNNNFFIFFFYNGVGWRHVGINNNITGEPISRYILLLLGGFENLKMCERRSKQPSLFIWHNIQRYNLILQQRTKTDSLPLLAFNSNTIKSVLFICNHFSISLYITLIIIWFWNYYYCNYFPYNYNKIHLTSKIFIFTHTHTYILLDCFISSSSSSLYKKVLLPTLIEF